ncbi:hypothetical protein DEJ48_11510 [Streptomyces venezuelae]|uniref:Uncharacterized protein n=1 Tax=Streptomyces venezuelae TaxID=54571 RepID=A0A5P2BUR8_STRVZ|nr:hypothetical protein [Streptomyces venezuelae]QES33937.1 hypothetical protein DEJ48_11510 [Streptomyces venezuelae]
MGTKTDDAAAAKGTAGTGAEADEVNGAGEPETVDVTKSDAADTKPDAGTDAVTDSDVRADKGAGADADAGDDALDASDSDADSDLDVEPVVAAKSTGVGQGAAAVVSAALGVIGLSGGWLGTIAGARSNIMGQLETKQSASVSDQLQAMYGDSWQATALVAGLFALSALVIGFLVLVRPAFGAPGKEQAPWIKSVAWAGFVLGVIGLVLAIAKYSDLLLGLPSAPS